MKPWEIWTGNLYGPHPAVLISCQRRIERKQRVVVLKCTTLRPGDACQPDELQAVLDQQDGLELRTRCDCDLLFTLEKSALTHKRSEVVWERRRDISQDHPGVGAGGTLDCFSSDHWNAFIRATGQDTDRLVVERNGTRF